MCALDSTPDSTDPLFFFKLHLLLTNRAESCNGLLRTFCYFQQCGQAPGSPIKCSHNLHKACQQNKA